MKNLTVKELKSIPEDVPQEFLSTLVYRKALSKTAKNGSEFLMVELGDKTGSFSVTCFSDTPEFNFFKKTKEGSIIRINGFSSYYNSRFSPKIGDIQPLSHEEAAQHLSFLIDAAPESPDDLWNELLAYISQISHPQLQATVAHALKEHEADFKVCPAAVSMHHAYRHGLLEHTTHVTRAGRALLPLYQEVDPDLATAGMILHDIGKVIEYDKGLTIKRTQTGILQGHVVLGYRIARKSAIICNLEPHLLERLEHIILSHQGELEWGAAAMAATPEAVFVSMVDNLDAKMGMVQQTLRQTPATDSFSEYLPGLKAPLLVTPTNIAVLNSTLS